MQKTWIRVPGWLSLFSLYLNLHILHFLFSDGCFENIQFDNTLKTAEGGVRLEDFMRCTLHVCHLEGRHSLCQLTSSRPSERTRSISRQSLLSVCAQPRMSWQVTLCRFTLQFSKFLFPQILSTFKKITDVQFAFIQHIDFFFRIKSCPLLASNVFACHLSWSFQLEAVSLLPSVVWKLKVPLCSSKES